MFSPMFMIWATIAALTTVGMGIIFNKKPQSICAVIMFIVFYFVSWAALPALAIDMLETWIMFIAITICAAILTSIVSGESENFVPGIVPVGVIVLMLLGMIFTSGMFNASKMSKVIDLTDHGQKSTTIELASQEQALRVTPNLAEKKAAELIGSAKTPALASIAKFTDMWGNVTKDGKAVWVAPLEPNGFWRWVSNPITPGYFICSHINSVDSRLVEDKPIAYGKDFFISHDLYRHLYINGYVNYKYGDAFFQIDDDGNPYYVVPLERPQVGFWCDFPEMWVIVDAYTGDIEEAKTHDELPKWVDRAYSADVMMDRLTDWGSFSAGAWAAYVSGVEVIDPTPNLVVTMNNKGEMIYYTGTQFHKHKVNGATSGVVTINARTGKTEFYRRAGITESAAIQIINGAVANFAGRTAENPVLIQENGKETYFSVITDESGALKGYGMVWQRDRNVYGVGDTVRDAIRNYLRSARNIMGSAAFESNSAIDEIVFNGLIVSKTPVSIKGNTVFYVRLDSVKDKVFMVNMENPAEIAVTNIGEPVILTTDNSDTGVIDVNSFDNLLINITESEGQKQLDADMKDVMDRYNLKMIKDNARAEFDNLSPNQIKQLLKIIKANN